MLYDPFWFQRTLNWAECWQNDGPKGFLAQSLSPCTCDSHGKGTKAEVKLMSQLTERGETVWNLQSLPSQNIRTEEDCRAMGHEPEMPKKTRQDRKPIPGAL